MRKKRFTKFGILTVVITIVSMLMFTLPLMGAAAATPKEATAAEKQG